MKNLITNITKFTITLALLNSSIAISATQSFLEKLSPDNIINYAETALGSKYIWGGDTWNPKDRSYGPDCSGLVQKAWGWPKRVGYKDHIPSIQLANGSETLPKLNTTHMLTNSKHKNSWTTTPLNGNENKVEKADALTRPGHTMLVISPLNKSGNYRSIEAVGGKVTKKTAYFNRKLSWLKSEGYKIQRRKNIVKSKTSPRVAKSKTPVKVVPPKKFVPKAIHVKAAKIAPPPVEKNTHIVKKGDTLWSLANKYKMSMARLYSLNKDVLKNVDSIRIGQKLKTS